MRNRYRTAQAIAEFASPHPAHQCTQNQWYSDWDIQFNGQTQSNNDQESDEAREQNKYSSLESISEVHCLCLEKMINMQGSGFTLIDRTSTNKLCLLFVTSLTLLSLMMTLLLYCRWWCGPSSSYLDQLTGCTLSVLVLVTAYHSGLLVSTLLSLPTIRGLRPSVERVKWEERSEWVAGPGRDSEQEDRPGPGYTACWVWLSVHTGPVCGPAQGSTSTMVWSHVSCVTSIRGSSLRKAYNNKAKAMEQSYHRHCSFNLF